MKTKYRGIKTQAIFSVEPYPVYQERDFDEKYRTLTMRASYDSELEELHVGEFRYPNVSDRWLTLNLFKSMYTMELWKRCWE